LDELAQGAVRPGQIEEVHWRVNQGLGPREQVDRPLELLLLESLRALLRQRSRGGAFLVGGGGGQRAARQERKEGPKADPSNEARPEPQRGEPTVDLPAGTLGNEVVRSAIAQDAGCARPPGPASRTAEVPPWTPPSPRFAPPGGLLRNQGDFVP